MHEYEHLFHNRDEEIDGQRGWYWLKSDTGAWDGPKQNWINSHKAMIQKHCKKFGSVISCGGNQGMYPMLLASMFQIVYTFEPDPWNFYALVHNCQRDNIIKAQIALGDVQRMISVHRCAMENTGMHSVNEAGGFIPMMRIDDFHFEDLDFIWLDTEGYEFKILQGGEKSIEKHKPFIMAENGNTEAIKKFLGNFGYKVVGQSDFDTVYSVDS